MKSPKSSPSGKGSSPPVAGSAPSIKKAIEGSRRNFLKKLLTGTTITTTGAGMTGCATSKNGDPRSGGGGPRPAAKARSVKRPVKTRKNNHKEDPDGPVSVKDIKKAIEWDFERLVLEVGKLLQSHGEALTTAFVGPENDFTVPRQGVLAKEDHGRSILFRDRTLGTSLWELTFLPEPTRQDPNPPISGFIIRGSMCRYCASGEDHANFYPVLCEEEHPTKARRFNSMYSSSSSSSSSSWRS